MRAIRSSEIRLVSLLEAFDFVGRRSHGRQWQGLEAAALRLGQRAKHPLDLRRRAHDALGSMRSLVEAGEINLIYTDEERRRISYHRSPGYWLTGIYPDPLATGEGVIELDDRLIYPAVVDIRALSQWHLPTDREKSGPKQKFAAFEAATLKFFESNFSWRNADIWAFAKPLVSKGEGWPSKQWGNELINRARERLRSSNA